MAYSCRCLNVCIKGFEREADLIQDKTNPTTWAVHSQPISFTLPSLKFIEDLSKPSLIVHQESVQKTEDHVNVKYRSLLLTESLAQWKTYTCSNCKTKTHLTYVNYGQTSIVINKGNLIEFEEQTRRTADITCFGILCQNAGTTSHLDLKDLPGACSIDLNKIQQIADLEIEKARNESAAKFELFRKEQEEQLRNVEERINLQKKALLGQIKMAQEASRSQSQQVESLSSFQLGNSLNEDREDSEEFTELDMFDESSSPQNRGSDDFDDDEETPNYQTRAQDDGEFDVLAKSVPVSIGVLSGARRSFYDDEDEAGIPAPEKMAASMQALAKSVGVNSTEMFGDLPRQRVSTFRQN